MPIRPSQLDSAIRKINVAPGNRQFRVERDFLINGKEGIVVRYIGPGGHLHIWRELRVLSKLCCEHAEVDDIEFEDGGQLATIDEMCFWFSTITKIRIPRTVKVLRDSCFMHARIAKVEFEPPSRLVRIEKNCPLTTVVIPAAVEFVAENAFPDDCFVVMEERDPSETPKDQPRKQPKEAPSAQSRCYISLKGSSRQTLCRRA
jgi:hypothetical protein